jgi:hypothetical protein
MNEKTKKSLYVLSDIGWRCAIGLGKIALVLCGVALIPSLALDTAEKKERKARTTNKKR